ncbi:MAG: helix-turn-helix transcriptional regulator, partial [Eubacteriales bacterium]
LFDRVFPYIEQHYTNKCSLMDVARELKYDYTYLSRVFSDFLGIPFHKYVISLRISDACYFLKNTQDTILEISQECGFTSLRSFNRNFSQFMNMTPSAYRTAQQSLPLERRTVQ